MIFKKYINKILLKYSWAFLIGIIALIVVNYVQLEVPEIFGKVIDGIDDSTLLNNDTLLLEYIKDILIIMVFMFIGRFLWRLFVMGSSINVETDLRSLMFEHAEKMSRNFYKQNKTGALMALFTNDLQMIRTLFSNGTVMIIDFFVLGGLTLYKMFNLSWQLTLIMLFPSVLVGISIIFISKKIKEKHLARQKSFEELTDFTQENFSGLSVIKAFVNEKIEKRKFSKKNKENTNLNYKVIKYLILINILLEVVLNLIIIFIIIFGSHTILFNDNHFTTGQLLEYVSYFNLLTWPMIAIGQFMNFYSQANSSYDRIREFLDTPVDLIDNELDTDIYGEIEFKHLSFKYIDSDDYILQDLSFKINKGEFVGILGKTGSGKTTIVDLLLRLYNVDKDMIYIDNKDIMDYSIKTLRDNLGYVPQDNFLFSDTIRNNIAFYNQDVDDELIYETSVNSDIHQNIIDFPEQYNTVLGERGVTLSGGQKQRVSIARALIKDPKIIIFDDSLSAVDTKTEKKILDNLRKVRKNKTTIMISSRVSTVISLDKIIVIDEGKLVGIGTHSELLKSCKLYEEMVNLQKLEEEVDNIE